MTTAAAITATGTAVTMTDPTRPAALRHELKHQINLREDLVLSQRLRRLFAHDRNAGEDGTYRVTSLYFDTPYDSALREKLDGVNRREKFRTGRIPPLSGWKKSLRKTACAASAARG